MARIPVGLVAVAICVGCSSTADVAPPVAFSDSAGVSIVTNQLAGLTATCSVDQSPAVSIGNAAGSDADQLYRVFGATRLSDGSIVLVNQGSQQVQFYDPAGQFLRSVGRSGEGPGEFRDAFYIWRTPGDTIWVGDYRPWRFNVFTADGAFTRIVTPTPTYPNSPSVMAVLDDGRSVLAARPPVPRGKVGFQLMHTTVVMHSADGELIDTLGTYPSGRWGTLDDSPSAPGLYPLFESFLRVDAGGSVAIVGHGATPEIRVFDLDGPPVLARIFRWTGSDRTVTPADVAAAYDAIREEYADLDQAMREMLLAPLVSDARPVADLFPSFSAAKVGRDGRIWIREYQRPSAPDANDWLVFGPNGSFECRASLPSVRQVLEFGADYVLALHFDEFDVERVWLLSLGVPIVESVQPAP